MSKRDIFYHVCKEAHEYGFGVYVYCTDDLNTGRRSVWRLELGLNRYAFGGNKKKLTGALTGLWGSVKEIERIVPRGKSTVRTVYNCSACFERERPVPLFSYEPDGYFFDGEPGLGASFDGNEVPEFSSEWADNKPRAVFVREKLF